MTDATEFDSRCRVRCPFCLRTTPASDHDGIYTAGDQETYTTNCGTCGEDFEVVVVIDTTFVSPKPGERSPE